MAAEKEGDKQRGERKLREHQQQFERFRMEQREEMQVSSCTQWIVLGVCLLVCVCFEDLFTVRRRKAPHVLY